MLAFWFLGPLDGCASFSFDSLATLIKRIKKLFTLQE